MKFKYYLPRQICNIIKENTTMLLCTYDALTLSTGCIQYSRVE